jgi:hypothetical protein
MTKIVTVLSLVALALLSFTATAFASQAVAGEDGSWLDLARPVLDAVLGGQWFLAAALALVLAAGLASKYGAKRWPVLGTGAGKAALVLLGAFGGACATALAAGTAPTAALMWTATQLAFAAAGGYSLVRALLGPLVAKAPAWLRPFIDLVLWFFDRKASKPSAADVAVAEAAGEAAVAAKPSTGVAGFIGKPRDIP